MLRLLDTMREPATPGEKSLDDWAICTDCYRYRPKSNKGFWEGVETRYHAAALVDDLIPSYAFAVDHWSIYAPQCPDCWVEKWLRRYGYTAPYGNSPPSTTNLVTNC